MVTYVGGRAQLSSKLADIAANQGEAVDSRYHPSAAVRRQLNKVFPTHWSFLLGEIALYSFIVLLITGRLPDLVLRPVDGRGHLRRRLPTVARRARCRRPTTTTLDISFEVRGGLFVRQMHHWAALLFAASIMVHLARIFFTGAFRRPREANWVIGCAAADPRRCSRAYFGYSLPDDLLSGTGLRAAFSCNHVGHPGGRHLAALGAVRGRLPRRRSSSRGCTSCTSC